MHALPTKAVASSLFNLLIIVLACVNGVFGRTLSAPGQNTFTLPLKEYVTVFEGPGPGGRHRRIHVSEYYGRVSFGSPPQVFDMVFDTGSGNVVLPTTKCTDEACTRHRRWVASDSKTAVQLAYDDGTLLQTGETDRDTTTITYGTGKLTGEYIRDICMGDPGAVNSMCTTVDFLGVVQESRFPFVELPFDGIFGLGLAGLSAGNSFNFVNRMRTNASVADPTFAVFLRNLGTDEDSEITFGGYRPERLEDPENGLKWLPVPQDEADGKGYWLVTMRDIYVKGQPLHICDDFGDTPRCQVAMDTGSSLMMGPPFAVNTLLSAIGGCSGTLPTLRFEFDAMGGSTFDVYLAPEDYAEFSSEGCATAFQPIELPPSLGPMWVLGQTALRKYYSVYDPKRWRVGIGLARHTTAKRNDDADSAATPTPAPSKLEACVDDDVDMTSNHLPGCKSFSQMGYCTRFPPLAQHYCKLSCNLCKPPAGATVMRASALATKSSAAEVSPHSGAGSFLKSGDAPAASSDGVTIRDSGISVQRYKRRSLSARRLGGGLSSDEN